MNMKVLGDAVGKSALIAGSGFAVAVAVIRAASQLTWERL
jgi:hypothetical protein